MTRDIAGNEQREAILCFDRYGGILYGLLIKATAGNTILAGDILVELFCDRFEQATSGLHSHPISFPDLLFSCQELLLRHKLDFDIVQYYLQVRG